MRTAYYLNVGVLTYLLFSYLIGFFIINVAQYNPPQIQRNVPVVVPQTNDQLTGDALEELHRTNIERGIAGELYDIIFPFISSLAPTWDAQEFVKQYNDDNEPPMPHFW